MTRVGLLHTVPSLAGQFDALVRAALPDVDVVHLAQADLLTRAVAGDPAVPRMVLEAIDALVDMGCAAILVTCSSIGEAAEHAGEQVRVPVLRLDAPMATRAVQIAGEAAAARAGVGVTSGEVGDEPGRVESGDKPGRVEPGEAGDEPGRVVVLATQPSTLGPSTRLVEQAAARAGGGVQVRTVLVEGAAAARAAGDTRTHDDLVLGAARAANTADVVVLAQASMAALADADAPVPILESITSGVAALARLVG